MKRTLIALALIVGLLASLRASAAVELLLFGDARHDTFIGCINCSRIDSSSICNRVGDYGSRLGDKSIWNRHGDYGSRLSDKSPWNRFASEPPVIVDREGKFYGYFTADRFKDKRTRIKPLLVLLDNADEVLDDLDKARDAICGD